MYLRYATTTMSTFCPSIGALILLPQVIFIRIIKVLDDPEHPCFLTALSATCKQLYNRAGDLREAVLEHLLEAARGGRFHLKWERGGAASGGGENQFNDPQHLCVDWTRGRVCVPD